MAPGSCPACPAPVPSRPRRLLSRRRCGRRDPRTLLHRVPYTHGRPCPQIERRRRGHADPNPMGSEDKISHATLAPSADPSSPAGMTAAMEPSSAAPDPPLSPPPSPSPHPQPPPEEEEEGDGWVVVPASEVEGAHAPKVIHWDDLQQELARLWSLSAALQPAGDRKAHLAARLDSVLQARQVFLEQDNELAGMRQRLQEQTDRLGDLKMRAKKLSEDVVDQREQLCVKIRTLSVASKALEAAHNNLKEANKLLSGENGRGRLKNLEQKLRMRQQYMIAQVAQIYPVRFLDEQSPDHKPGFTSNITKTTYNSRRNRNRRCRLARSASRSSSLLSTLAASGRLSLLSPGGRPGVRPFSLPVHLEHQGSSNCGKSICEETEGKVGSCSRSDNRQEGRSGAWLVA